MKKITLSLMAMLLVGAMACKKSGASLSGNLSASEAVDLMAGSLSTNTHGLTSMGSDASLYSQSDVDAHITCGATRTDTVTKTSPAGASTSFSYGLGYSYTLNCNANNLPDNVIGKLNYTGTFSNPHMSSANAGHVTFTVAGLTTNATAYVFNGSYLRTGSFASKSDTTNHGSSSLDIEVHSLMLHKPDRAVVSGNATFTLTGTIPKKGAFSFTGTVLFNGDGTAKITVNGSSYVVDLTTGEKTKV